MGRCILLAQSSQNFLQAGLSHTKIALTPLRATLVDGVRELYGLGEVKVHAIFEIGPG